MKYLFLLLTCLFSTLGCSQNAAPKTKTPVDAFEKLILTDKTIQLVDVRTPQEVANGYIANAVNINSADGDFQAKLGALDKSKPIAVYCGVGGRSGKAATLLTQMGFKTIYDLDGGITAWKNQNKPIVKK
jgi:rhodanese-related sulfurtransferase